MTSLGGEHRFGLDAVRCTAILLVLGCHCGLAFTAWSLVGRPAYLGSFGYYGVELFFVLSGFLIGGLLLDIIAFKSGALDWLIFMVRRWLRTLPLYFVWLAIIAVTWPPGPMHDDWNAVWHLVPSYASFTQNLAWPANDWFAVAWSLSIEEWFYLAFSLALIVSGRLLGPRRAIVVVVSAFLALPLMLRLSQPVGVNWNEYLHKAVVFRLDAIAFGVAVVAMVRIKAPSTRVRAIMLFTGIAMIVAQWYDALPFGATIGIRASRALGFDVTDLGFALMLPAIVLVPKPVAWINTPVRLFAAQSYGTYLTHYTLIEWVGFARGTTHWGGTSSSLIATALILILPALSWHCFEKRLLVLRPASRDPGKDVYVHKPSRRLA